MANPAHPDPRTLLGQLKAQIRVRHYSLRTEEAYVYWTRRFLRFHNHQHPRELGAQDLKAFLSSLAEQGGVAASTQNRALSASGHGVADGIHDAAQGAPRFDYAEVALLADVPTRS